MRVGVGVGLLRLSGFDWCRCFTHLNKENLLQMRQMKDQAPLAGIELTPFCIWTETKPGGRVIVGGVA